jgi:hypothetical protein
MSRQLPPATRKVALGCMAKRGCGNTDTPACHEACRCRQGSPSVPHAGQTSHCPSRSSSSGGRPPPTWSPSPPPRHPGSPVHACTQPRRDIQLLSSCLLEQAVDRQVCATDTPHQRPCWTHLSLQELAQNIGICKQLIYL